MTIGKNIKGLRVNKGITQEQLAGQLHITDKAVSKWENETAFPDISLLPTIAAYILYQKYGVIVNYCHDRKVLDSRGRLLRGYTIQDGDRIESCNSKTSKPGKFILHQFGGLHNP